MWFKGRRSSDRLLTPVGVLLIVETEAFLSGGFARQARLLGNPVPAWSWLNVFAHGELSSLEELRSSLGGSASLEADDEERPWKSAQLVLADELARLIDGDADLFVRIQQRVLVPLELQLMRTEVERGLTAPDLVQATRAALRSSIA